MPKYITFKSTIVFILYLITLGALINIFSGLSNHKKITNSSYRNLNYVSHTNQAPQVIHENGGASIQEVKIVFEFTNNDPTFSYGNLFQTSSNPDGIRLEFQPQNKLFLILGKDKLYLIADDIRAHQPYQIDIFLVLLK